MTTALTGAALVLIACVGKGCSGGTPLGKLLRTMGELLLIFVVLWAPGYALLSRHRRLQLSDADIALLAFPLTLLGYLAAFVVLYASSAPQIVYQLIYLSAVALAAAEILRQHLSGTPVVVPRVYLITFLLALCAACFICTGLGGSPWKLLTWDIPANRATHPLAEDNSLQWASAQVFIHHREPWAWNDGYWNWSMGDRPALLGALTALYAKSFLSYRALSYFDYTLIGIVLNALYVIPAAHLAHTLLRSERRALLAALTVALMPYFFVNVYYTWPKLAGVFFSLTALTFCLGRSADEVWAFPRVRAGLALGALLGLAASCHGGSILSAPCVVLLVSISARRHGVQQLLRGLCALLFGFAAVATPWAVYLARHPAIQTNNLASHYRPSLERPGHVMEWTRWLAEYPLEQQLPMRWNQLSELLAKSEFRASWEAYTRGELDHFYEARWPKEFRQPVSQVDELRIVLGALCLGLLVATFAWRRWRSIRAGERVQPDSGGNALLRTLLLLGVPTASYVANVLLKWTEVVPHALPIAEIVCISITLALCAYQAGRWFGHALLWSVLARFLHFTLTQTMPPHHQLFGVFGVGFGSALGLLLWTALSTPDREASSNLRRVLASTRPCPPRPIKDRVGQARSIWRRVRTSPCARLGRGA